MQYALPIMRRHFANAIKAIGKGNQEEHLKVFLTDSEVPIDDSASERALRNFTIGRNWVTINTIRGTQASAVIYSVTETARANGLNVYIVSTNQSQKDDDTMTDSEKLDLMLSKLDKVDKIKKDITDIKLTLENEIRVNIQRVAEGQLDLSRNLHDAMKTDSEKEMLAIRVNVLETELRRNKSKLEIA